MDSLRLITFFAILIAGCNVFAEGVSTVSEEVSGSVRETRHLHKKRLCRKYGICDGYGGYHGNQGYGGQQGYGEQQGYGGYPGYPINIAISQSQSSANEGGGGYTHGSYPNNYQYNGGYPNHGYNHGYNQGYKNRPGYFGNGYGSYNNQFNGNYYGSGPNHGSYYDGNEDGYDNDQRQNGDYAVAESYAEAGRSNS